MRRVGLSPSQVMTMREMVVFRMSRSRLTRCLLVALLTVVITGAFGRTVAQAAGPAWTVAVTHAPDTFQRGDTGATFEVTVTNSGDADTSGTISLSDVLSPGMKFRRVNPGVLNCPSDAALHGGAPLTCTTNQTLAAGESLLPMVVTVAVATDAPDAVTNTVTVSGGGVAGTTSANESAPVVDRAAFGVLGFTARALDSNGDDYTVAGGHPYEARAKFSFPTYPTAIDPYPVEDVKNIVTELPPGFVGNAAAFPRCELPRFSMPFLPTCPPESIVGLMTFGTYGGPGLTFSVYNMVPEHGYPAEFAFKALNNAAVMYARLRPRTGGYGLAISVPGAARLGITSIELTFYGTPSERNGVGGLPIPFLTNPSDCLTAQPVTKIAVDSWQHPGRKLADGSPDYSDPNWKTATTPAPPVTGCDAPALASQFAPTIEARPTPTTGSTQADAPSGYQVDLSFPQTNDPTDPNTTFDPAVPMPPQLKDATVTLPAGVAISPSGANGLDGCSDLASDPAGDQVRLDSTVPVTCPDASKIGTVVATSPLLAAHDPDTDAVTGADPLSGDVYIVKPHAGDLSPNGDRDGTFRVLIQIQSDLYGINVKLPGVVTADRTTGRLTARFENNPQLPLKHLSLTFKSGDRAPLVNPATCTADATTTGVFTPWSRGGTRSDGVTVLGTPDVTASSKFGISWDGKGAACPSTLPFAPTVAAGTLDPQAGGSSPFSFDLAREDRNDILAGLSVALPGGLLAAVKDVPLCGDADANAGTCPAGSRVGSASVASGSGGSPFYINDQPVSLTGPYKGAPYGLAIAVHAVAGPFDLGTVVVRQALNVDPNDAHVTVVSDPLPTIRDGVPLRIRRIHVDINRPGFMRSPTSCAPKTIEGTATSAGGQSASFSTPFQVTGCDKLPFAPKLAMHLTNASQTKVGGHPGIEALVTQKPGEAALKSATVTLPLSLALDAENAASDDLCEYADGLKDRCPERSVIGSATAVSPLLKAPLTGKVFFVKNVRTSPSGRVIRTLPTLLVELRGEINVNLRATTASPDNKHLATTFPLVPDAAISSFALKLKGGPKGIIVVTDGAQVCRQAQKPFFSAIGQNGKRSDIATTLTSECPLALSRTFTSSSVHVRITGLGAGTVTVSGKGLRTTRRTIKAATSATVVAKLTATGKKMRRAKKDVRVKVSFVPKGAKKAKVAYSPLPKGAKKRA